jgi:hypothetical protein
MRLEAIAIFSMASAEVAEFGRRAGLRIQWSNPWGFESPLSHLAVFDSNKILKWRSYEAKERNPRLFEKEKEFAAAQRAGHHQDPSACAASTRSAR